MSTPHEGQGNDLHSSADFATDTLNRACFCRSLNVPRLKQHLERDLGQTGLLQTIEQTRPNLFSSTAVFISSSMQQRIAAIVSAVESVTALSVYRDQALLRAPDIAHTVFGPSGVCMGYDFHLGADGPQLIEINTNAGGVLLNTALAQAQQACCKELDWAFVPNPTLDELEQTIFDMFVAEWRSQRGDARLGSVVIVDDDPTSQYLAPEFELFKAMFQRHGLAASIADPSALTWRDNRLWHMDTPVDMVYNRLTDFYLADSSHQALRSAYEAGAVVMTPHPHAHALYANKRNLVTLSDETLLQAWGVTSEVRNVLKAGIPRTESVTADRADALWAQRRHLFFKPAGGFGAKAVYSGNKLTRRVWQEILQGDYVAQALVAPGERLIELDGVLIDLKFDLRAYAYNGQVQLMAARIYSGQTTNFRTEGGGFAPVIVITPKAAALSRTVKCNTEICLAYGN